MGGSNADVDEVASSRSKRVVECCWGVDDLRQISPADLSSADVDNGLIILVDEVFEGILYRLDDVVSVQVSRLAEEEREFWALSRMPCCDVGYESRRSKAILVEPREPALAACSSALRYSSSGYSSETSRPKSQSRTSLMAASKVCPPSSDGSVP